MKNKVKIRLRNAIANNVDICLEPEGTIIPFKSGEEKVIEISGNDETSIEIVIGMSSDGLNLAFWPDKETYNFESNG